MALGGGGGGNAGGIRAGRAYVELGAKDSLTGALKRIGSKFAAFGKMAIGATGIGGAVGGVLGGLSFKDTVDDLSKMNSAIKALGLSATGGSGLFGVLNQFSDVGENIEGLTQFSQKVQDAFDGVGTEGAKLFEGLSVSAADLIDLPLDEKFMRIHAAIRELPQAQQQFKLSMLGGTDSMKKWLPLLSMSNAELREQAKNLAFGNEELNDATAASKAMTQAGGALNRVWQQFVIAVAPMVADGAKWISQSIKPLVEWSKGRTLGMVWDEIAARFRVAWEDVKLAVAEAWIEIGARTKIGLITVGEFVNDLFTNKFWAGLVQGAALQFSAVSQMFTDLLNGMRDEAVKIGQQIADALTDPRKLAMLPLLPLAAPLAAAELKRRADEVIAEQTKKLMADAAAGKFGAIDKAGIRAEADAAKVLAGAGAAAARADLARVLGDIEANRKRRAGDDVMNMEIGGGGRGKLAGIGQSAGTFGAGSFLTQGFGRQSANDPVKEMVREQKKGNVLLKDVVEAVKGSVLRFS